MGNDWIAPKTSSQDEYDNCLSYSDKSIQVEVKGPYGTSIGRTEDFSHAIAVGSGTGIVPVLSMLKQHVHQLLRLDTKTYFTEQELRDRKIRYVSETRGYSDKPICRLTVLQRSEHWHRGRPSDEGKANDDGRLESGVVARAAREIVSLRCRFVVFKIF